MPLSPGTEGRIYMSKIQNAFSHKNGKVFIPFIICGDPCLEMTEQFVYAMENAGADIIELGIPFSDPTVESPIIRAASIRALGNGVTTDKIFEMVEKIRKNTNIPLVFKTYANVVYSYGTEKFVKKAAELDMDGLILADVLYDEKEEFDTVCRAYGIDFISVIAPTSCDRIRRIAREAAGYVYCVAPAVESCTEEEILEGIRKTVGLAKKETTVPCAVSSGIATPERAAEVAALSDGIIVGTAVIKLCGEYGMEAVPHVKEYVEAMCQVVHGL